MAVDQGVFEARPAWNWKMLHLAEWSLVLLASLVGLVSGGETPWGQLGFLILGLAWLARALRTGKRFLPQSPTHIPLAIFLLSAGVGLWAAPNASLAFGRFFLILSAVSAYLLLLDSSIRERRIFSLGFAFLIGVGSLFLSTQVDWPTAGWRVGLFMQVGQGLNGIFPQLHLSLPHWNVLRNLIASLSGLGLLFLFGAAWEARLVYRSQNPGSLERREAKIVLILTATAGFLLAVALAVTTSRTPWVVFLVLAFLAILARAAASRPTPAWIKRVGSFWLAAAAAVGIFGLLIGWQAGLFDRLAPASGPYSIAARSGIYSQSWQLAREKPFTGAGLGAFPAMYSTYIQIIPFRSFLDEDTGNNAYLNLLVEQGWLGLFGFVLLLAVALRSGIQGLDDEWGCPDGASPALPYLAAGLMGVIFVALHGITHATLVASRALPLLLAPVGMLIASIPCKDTGLAEPAGAGRLPRNVWVSGLAVLLVTIALLPGVRAQAMANLGALKMDWEQLADFPRHRWVYAPTSDRNAPGETWLGRALEQDPDNMTAHFRLGVTAMQGRDFDRAAKHLEQALASAPNHRGVLKSLAYSLLWSGEIEQALRYLEALPEASQELEAYVYWWQQNGRQDLCELARETILHLNEGKTGSCGDG